jgi:hypothetical protein
VVVVAESMKSLISRDFSTKNLKMDFFDLSDGIHSDDVLIATTFRGILLTIDFDCTP